jgi:hypothetical protein
MTEMRNVSIFYSENVKAGNHLGGLGKDGEES